MLTVFIILAALGFLMAIGGAVWLTVPFARAQGPREKPASASQRPRFARSAGGSAGATYGELKQWVRAGQWRLALPAILGIAGVLLAALSTALVVFFGQDDRLFGAVFLAIAVIAVGGILRGIIRA